MPTTRQRQFVGAIVCVGLVNTACCFTGVAAAIYWTSAWEIAAVFFALGAFMTVYLASILWYHSRWDQWRAYHALESVEE